MTRLFVVCEEFKSGVTQSHRYSLWQQSTFDCFLSVIFYHDLSMALICAFFERADSVAFDLQPCFGSRHAHY